MSSVVLKGNSGSLGTQKSCELGRGSRMPFPVPLPPATLCQDRSHAHLPTGIAFELPQLASDPLGNTLIPKQLVVA